MTADPPDRPDPPDASAPLPAALRPRARPRRRRLLLKTLLALALLLAALVAVAKLTLASWLPPAIARAPNAGRTVADLATRELDDGRFVGGTSLRVDVGEPRASLALRILEPAEASTGAALAPTPATPRPRGTVFVLHGIRDSKRSMQGIAQALVARRFRVVLVDLRGHGSSTGDVMSYGPREGKDLHEVADALASRGLLEGAVGAYGPSYGGAAALAFAREDARVTAVVTVATFSRMRDVVPLYVHRALPRWFASDADVERAMARAAELAGTAATDADSVAAIRATGADVLLVHGKADRHIPWQQSEALHDAAPDRARLFYVDDRDHFTVMADPRVTAEAAAFFEAHLVAAPAE